MLLLAAAAIAASSSPTSSQPQPQVVVQARAMIRIVSGVRLKWGEKPSGDIPPARTTVIRTANGPEQAKLIEFE